MPTSPKPDSYLPLPIAAQKLGLTWQQMYALVLRGAVQAEHRQGRWYVSSEDVRKKSERQR